MKTLNITFEDAEHKALVEAKTKAGKNWRKFILTLIKTEETNKLE